MNYPTNSREVAFLSTAQCREVFARLVRELDKLDEEGAFGPFGWRDRLAGPPPPAKSMSGEYRDQLAAAEYSDLVHSAGRRALDAESGEQSLGSEPL